MIGLVRTAVRRFDSAYRLASTKDEARPAAVARRRATGQRTARENLSAVVDEGTFVE